jgi:hypothetical protein
LKVQAAQRAHRRAPSRVYLRDCRVEAGGCELVRAPLPGKESSLVTPRLELDHKYSVDLRFGKNHV